MLRYSLALLALTLPLLAADHTYTSTDGVTLHYTILGKGKPVVVLSGGPGFTIGYMLPMAEELAKEFQVILPEQRGTGRSVLATYDDKTVKVAKVVDDLEKLRQELQLDKLTLLGHSWGGMLAMIYASGYPDRVEKLVLVDSGGPTLAFAETFGKKLESRYTADDRKTMTYWSAEARRKADPAKATIETFKGKLPAYFHDRSKSRELAASMTAESYDSRVNRLLFSELMTQKYDLRPTLKKNVRAPVLVVQGTEDPLQATDEIMSALPQAKRVWIEESGHFPWLEQPAKYYRAVGEFLR
jgi:proline iminopeptidase